MNLNKKIKYNIAQAAKNKWAPAWFGCTIFDAELIAAIEAFQISHDLLADGLCGPATYRRIFTEKESTEEKHILFHDIKIPIHWPKVVLFNESNGLKCKQGSYSVIHSSTFSPDYFITHWDVALSSKSCEKILSRRNISVHFTICNDSTIYQLLPMGSAYAWHAGSHNRRSIGVEVSCAYNLKYQGWYKRRFGARPIWKDVEVHGKKLKPFLGFYDEQIKALAALWEATSRACDIPLEIPQTDHAVDSAVANGEFSGYCCHYHATGRKIDAAGLSMIDVLNRAKEIRRLNQ